ncbi:MAG: PQQ-binding-like beta-propeller repeat protein [Acidobacteria bacterium]|nr:PQQ-binding-like beta-propeller repeat protein [Acidobacteriota bacterium]
MAGVNPQRTGVYQTRGLSRVTGLAWKSDRIFAAQYMSKQTSYYRTETMVGWTDYYMPTFFDFSDPLLAGSTLYFQAFLGHGYLFAVDVNTGRMLWDFKAEKDWLSLPAVAGDTAFVGAGTGVFYAIDAGTGKEKWRFKGNDGGYSGSAPLVSGGLVYFGSMKGQFHALEAATGKESWGFKTKGALTQAAMSDGSVFVGSDEGYLYALDGKTGAQQWSFKFGGDPLPPVCGEGAVYFRTTKGDLYAVDAKTGQKLWSSPVGVKASGLPVFSLLRSGRRSALYDGTIYFCGGSKLHAWDARTGQSKWEFATEAPCHSPVVADGIVYVGSLGKLYAVDARTGQQRTFLEGKEQVTDKKTISYVVSSPAVSNGLLYVVSDDGHVYAVK